jgi:hypothetical protein
MKEIPVLGWVCLGGIIFFVLGLYLSLFTAWRRKNQQSPKNEISGEHLINTLRQPWAREDAEWEKLHKQAEELRKNNQNTPDT